MIDTSKLPSMDSVNAAFKTSNPQYFGTPTSSGAKEVSVVSTDQGNKVLKTAADSHAADLNAAKNNTTTSNTTTNKPDPTKTNNPANTDIITASEASAAGIDLSKDYTYDSGNGYYVKNTSPSNVSNFDNDKRQINSTFSNMTGQMDAANSQLINSIMGIYQARIDEQKEVNRRYESDINTENIRGGTSRYSSGVASGILTTAENYGLQKVTELNAQMALALANANQSYLDKKYTVFLDQRKELNDLTTKRNAAIKDLHDQALAAQKEQQTKIQKTKDDITGIVKSASENGADQATISKISSSKDLNEAISNAGSYLQKGTGDVADYLFYKNQAIAEGHTPKNFSDFMYEQELNKEKAKNNAGGLPDNSGDTPVGLGGDGKGGSILSQTGLSIQAFNYLTQGTASLSRLSAGQRTQIMNEASKFLNKNGIDVSTFQSQYKSYNDVLQKNISRANQTQIMAGEVAGSADSLMEAIDEKDMGNIKAKNIVALMLGNEVNDATTQKYATQLRLMANDLAGYLAAARGATGPELQDQRDAAEIISNGMSKRSVQAFKDSITANEAKVFKVVNSAVDSTRKQVWGLFGVANNYKGGNSTADSMVQDTKSTITKIKTFHDKSPENASMYDKIIATAPDATPEEVAQLLGI
jgi:hypothetical protein